MLERLLVPLDGSRLAEAVLPAAAYLAEKLHARVTLIHVIEHNAPQDIHGERHLGDVQEAQEYLQEVAARSFPSQVQVEVHVHTNEVMDVARSLVEHAAEFGIDLIAMCTHGRGGLRSFLYGSIAQQVLALGATPVLLVQPSGADIDWEIRCKTILIPLDGDPDHEGGLSLAVELGRACGAQLHLLMVIHTTGTLPGERAATAILLPSSTSAVLELTLENAQAYLSTQVERLKEQGIPVTREVQRGDPAQTIAQAAQQIQADLIVLGTHGKSSMDAFWSGSITPKLTSQTQLPLLLVPVRDTGPVE